MTFCLRSCPSSICLSTFFLSPPPQPPRTFTPVLSFNIKRCVECRLQADGAEREDAAFVWRCLPLLQSKWKRPVGSSVCVYLSISEGGNKAWKCCPQALCVRVCVFGWRSRSDRSRRSNIVYNSLPCRFIFCRHLLSCSLSIWSRLCQDKLPDLCLTETDTEMDTRRQHFRDRDK